MIDEKKCYFFGRNKELCDFTSRFSFVQRWPSTNDALLFQLIMPPAHVSMLPFFGTRSSVVHFSSISLQVSLRTLSDASTSRFLAHGTFIGHILLESNKAQQVHVDSEIHFGESSRIYIIRERPQAHGKRLQHVFGSGLNAMHGGKDANGDHNDENREGNGAFPIPESEIELDVSWTESDWDDRSKRIASSRISPSSTQPIIDALHKSFRSLIYPMLQLWHVNEEISHSMKKTMWSIQVRYWSETNNEIDSSIHRHTLEDVDPNVGRFRNLVQTTIVVPKVSGASLVERMCPNGEHRLSFVCVEAKTRSARP